ncbi:MAG: PKD domain-containing protein [Bacteroidia bacterium]
MNTTGQVSILTYSWDFGDNSMIQLTPNPSHLYANGGSFLVQLTVISSEGCMDSIRKSVFVYPSPPSPTVKNDTVCLGKGTTLLAITSPPNKAYWFENEQDNEPVFIGSLFPINSLFENKTFYAQSVSQYQCKSEKVPVFITIPTLDAQTLPIAPQVELPMAEVSFSVSANAPIAAYTWDFGDENIGYGTNPTHQYKRPGIFFVSTTLIDIFGCKYLETNQVEVRDVFGLFVPSAFSPNGDQENDEFFIAQNQILSLQFQVFDRWGRIVFSSTDPNFKWNGKDIKTAQDVPEGVYTYYVKAVFENKKEQTQTGTITVIR